MKKPKVTGKVCHVTTGLGFPIQLRRDGSGRYIVICDKQVHIGLSHAQAAAQYGAAIMHALLIKGVLKS